VEGYSPKVKRRGPWWRAFRRKLVRLILEKRLGVDRDEQSNNQYSNV
jgi:hypothetical protein